jgi:hypothetical protein
MPDVLMPAPVETAMKNFGSSKRLIHSGQPGEPAA